MHVACREGNVEAARALLLNMANVEMPDADERLPRAVALDSGHLEIVRLIDEHRAMHPFAAAPGLRARQQQLAAASTPSFILQPPNAAHFSLTPAGHSGAAMPGYPVSAALHSFASCMSCSAIFLSSHYQLCLFQFGVL